jgi:hypothetical protein
MRDNAMNDRDDLDILLNAALATYVDPGAAPGLISRILTSTCWRAKQVNRHIDNRRPLRWLPWAVPTLAALLLVVIFTVRHAVTHRVELSATAGLSHPSELTPHAPAISTPSPKVETHLAAASNPRQIRQIKRPMHAASPPPLPRLEVFPTPTPLSQEERALVDLANRRPDQAAQVANRSLADRSQEQAIEPIRIAAIHIPPLNLPDNDTN